MGLLCIITAKKKNQERAAEQLTNDRLNNLLNHDSVFHRSLAGSMEWNSGYFIED